MFIIKVRKGATFFSININGILYFLKIFFIEKDGFYYVDLYDKDNNAIHLGQRMVKNFPIFGRKIDERYPNGYFFFVEMNDQVEECKYDQIGVDFVFTFNNPSVVVESFDGLYWTKLEESPFVV